MDSLLGLASAAVPFSEILTPSALAKDLGSEAGARKKLAGYTLEGRANRIECPMLIGYSKDDRIMYPAGALNLYQSAVNCKREMVEGTGHNQASNAGGPRSVPAHLPRLGRQTTSNRVLARHVPPT